MPTRPTTLRTLTAAAVLPLALVSPAWGHPDPPGAAALDVPTTLCAPAGVLRGSGRQWASVSLCVGSGTPVMTVSAAANCGFHSAKAGYACRTSGAWAAARHGSTVASGVLPGSVEYPGPGTYDITATVRVQSVPAGVDLIGTVHATLTPAAPGPAPTHRVEVDRSTPHTGATTRRGPGCRTPWTAC